MNAIALVDGLNLYHGMASAGLLKYRWLDIRKMCVLLGRDAGSKLGHPIELGAVTYCSSYVTDKQAQSRQDLFFQALEAHTPDFEIVRGRYEAKGRECNCDCGCHNMVSFQKEKRTDVNLAVGLVTAAADPATRPDVALLITGDTDLIPAIEAAREYGTKVVVVAPPARDQPHLNAAADLYLRIRKQHLKGAPLPPVVHRPDNGFPLTPPNGWVAPEDW